MANQSVWNLTKVSSLSGAVTPGPDKSITHRAVILGSIAQGMTIVVNPLLAEDTMRTIRMVQDMGIEIRWEKDHKISIKGKGYFGLKPPCSALDAGNSGTTMRLMAGILAGQSFDSTLVGDASLSRRPMKRIVDPLRQMGAHISTKEGTYPPLVITGGRGLKGISWKSPVASAQVKSSVLLAGLFAQGETVFSEPILSRDHSERMLLNFGAPLTRQGLTVTVKGTQKSLRGTTVIVPGDISSAAFFLVAGLIVPHSRVKLCSVGVNPTRTGILQVLKRMNAVITQEPLEKNSEEPVAHLTAVSCPLKAAEITGQEIPALVDEIPILAVAATQAEGTTIISGAQELRVKETDRLTALAKELSKMGALIEEEPDGLRIKGPTKLKGAVVKSYGDHRMAMSLAVASLVAEGETVVEDISCVATSYPEFWESLHALRG